MIRIATDSRRSDASVEALFQRLQDDKGSVVLETALVLMIALTLVFGIIEFCILSYTLAVLSSGASVGVRYAASHGTDSTNCSGPSQGCTDSSAANVVNVVNDYIGDFLHDGSSISITVSYPDSSSSPSSRVAVAVVYQYQPLFGFPGMSHTFSLSSQGTIVY